MDWRESWKEHRSNLLFAIIGWLGGGSVMGAIGHAAANSLHGHPTDWVLFGMFTVVGTVLIAIAFFAMTKRATPQGKTQTVQFPFTEKSPSQQELVMNRHFLNETIDIDGKHFMGCTFVNVKLRYNGTSNFSLTNVHFQGFPIVTSDNPGVESGFMLLKSLGMTDVPFLLNGVPLDIKPPTTSDNKDK
jgi:hypothetical protein